MEDAGGDAVAVQRQPRPDRQHRTGRAPAGNHPRRSVACEHVHRRQVGAEKRTDRLRDSSEYLIRSRLSCHEDGHSPQRRPLLGELSELGCPRRDLRLELVPHLAERFFGARPFFDEACVMEGRRGVIRGQGQQQLVDRRRKVAARPRGGDEAAVAVDPDGDGNTATRLRGVTDVGNDRPMGKSSRSALTFQPVRKPLPRITAR
ncbi:MAG TPA: hypothetical protein VK841_25955, partial [Polyangiaceae bacterium]|nr:hypothetical protein [Polyangiaceae bacterium]